MPRFLVPDKYLRMHLAAVWCDMLGFAVKALSLLIANTMSGHVAIVRY